MSMRRLQISQLCFAIFTVSLVSSCTVGDFKSAEGDDLRTTTVARPYQAVFRDVRQYAQCMESGWIGSEVKVAAQLYTDINRGEVQIYQIGVLGKQNYYAVDLESVGPNSTNVTIRRGLHPIIVTSQVFDSFIEAARGHPPACPL